MDAFRHVVRTTEISSAALAHDWKDDFLQQIRKIVLTFKAEEALRSRESFTLQEWLDLRAITISLRPYMCLFRVALGLPSDPDCFTFAGRVEQRSTLRQFQTVL